MVTPAELQGLAGGTSMNSDRSKRALTKAFVDSQKRHATVYAVEGKREFSSWAANAGEEVCKSIEETKVDRVIVGFSSPILQPRNAKCPNVVECHAPTLSDSKPDLKGGKERKCEEVARCTTQSVARTKTEKAMGKPGKKSMTEATKEHGVKGKDKSRSYHKVGQKRRGGSTSDEEREERLAQRRARRQRKKEIINPKACDEAETSRTGDAPDKQDHSTKIKPNRHDKSKLPAGLALMHGFSADNIGKHRLTMVPTTSTGVFNKGRASTKAQVQKKRVAKAPATFDELGFLNKLSTNDKTRRFSVHVAQRADSVASSDEGTNLPCRRRNHSHQKSVTTEASSSHSCKISEELSAALSIAKRSSGDEVSNYESQVWEIEKEFLQEADNCAEYSPEHSPIINQGSVVIDSKRWDWGHFKCSSRVDHLQSQLIVDNGLRNERPGKGCSSAQSIPTITPSQSASQVATPSSPPDLRAKSKFFSVTEEKQNALGNGIAEGQSTRAPSPERDAELHAPSDRRAESPDDAAELANTTRETPPSCKVKVCEDNSDLSSFLHLAMRELATEASLATGKEADHCPLSVPVPTGFPPTDVHVPNDATDIDLPSDMFLSRAHWSLHRPETVFDHTNVPEKDHTHFLCYEEEDGGCKNLGLESGIVFNFDYDIGYNDATAFDKDSGQDDEVECGDGYGYDYECDEELPIQAGGQTPLLSEGYNHVTYAQSSTGHDFSDGEFESWSDAPDELVEPDVSATWYDGAHLDQRDGAATEESSWNYEDRSSAESESLFNATQPIFLTRLEPISSMVLEPLGSLKDAENAVAKAFKKNFHPIKF